MLVLLILGDGVEIKLLNAGVNIDSGNPHHFSPLTGLPVTALPRQVDVVEC